MNRDDERLLARATTGAAGREERAELERRAARDPLLAAELERWRGVWERLELPEPGAPPAGFAARVAARARAEAEAPALGSVLGLSAHPALARAAAVLLVGAGVALGAALGSLAPADDEDSTTVVWTSDSLADTYLDAAASADGNAGEATP